MQVNDIQSIKELTDMLFSKNTFDDALLVEAEFVTFAKFSITGRRIQVSDGEEDFITWSRLKHICFEILKGKQLPQSFKLFFHLPKIEVEKFARLHALSRVDGTLCFAIRYTLEKTHVISTYSSHNFTLDKSIDALWDTYFFKQCKGYGLTIIKE